VFASLALCRQVWRQWHQWRQVWRQVCWRYMAQKCVCSTIYGAMALCWRYVASVLALCSAMALSVCGAMCVGASVALWRKCVALCVLALCSVNGVKCVAL
jgi:hypothetical protein